MYCSAKFKYLEGPLYGMIDFMSIPSKCPCGVTEHPVYGYRIWIIEVFSNQI